MVRSVLVTVCLHSHLQCACCYTTIKWNSNGLIATKAVVSLISVIVCQWFQIYIVDIQSFLLDVAMFDLTRKYACSIGKIWSGRHGLMNVTHSVPMFLFVRLQSSLSWKQRRSGSHLQRQGVFLLAESLTYAARPEVGGTNSSKYGWNSEVVSNVLMINYGRSEFFSLAHFNIVQCLIWSSLEATLLTNYETSAWCLADIQFTYAPNR